MNNMLSILPIRNWYPSRLHFQGQHVCSEWMQLENIPFTDPFFDEALAKARSKPINSHRFRPTSSVEILDTWSSSLEHIAPTAFIFHVSRCGSTLLSQLLGLNPQYISLAEVPFFDDLIRLPFKGEATVGFPAEQTLAAAVRIYGQQRTGNETHLFIKLDSWHVFFWKQLRALYPEVPFILLYRRPDEVVRSHRKLRGMHAVPGLIEPAVFGFQSEAIEGMGLDMYLARVLERYFGTYLDVLAHDSHSMLLNYEEGPLALLQRMAQYCGLQLNEAHWIRAAERSMFHAKDPAQVFCERAERLGNAPDLRPAFEWYAQLETMRRGMVTQ